MTNIMSMVHVLPKINNLLDHTVDHISIYRISSNRQYLRRAQLIVKELSIVVKESPLEIDEMKLNPFSLFQQ